MPQRYRPDTANGTGGPSAAASAHASTSCVNVPCLESTAMAPRSQRRPCEPAPVAKHGR